MVEHRPRHGFGLLYVREVGGVRDHLEAGTGDGVADELAVLGRGRWIVGAVIEASLSRRSMSRMASQHPA